MARVFVSHASQDRDVAREVFGWLGREGHELFFDQDLRAGLTVGEMWQDRLFERLRWADAVACVVTSAYAASAWCSAEVGIAISRGSRVLPVVVQVGVRHPLLDGIEYADYATNPGAARSVIGEALRRLDSGGGRGWVDGRSPFPGLSAFDTDMQRVFFGRRTDVGKLTELLRSPGERADRGMVVITGPSGCGKSSLVRAGLLPAMADDPGWWTLPVVLPGVDPVAALAREITGEARRLGLDWQLARVRSLMHGRGVSGLVDELLLATPRNTHQRRRLLIVIDQLEELLTLTSGTDRGRFAGVLLDALAGSATLVATLRPEFLAPMLASPELGVLRPRSFLVRPLDREALPEVIQGPAALAGIWVDPELVHRLVTDTGSGEALPLLAFTLQQLAADTPRGGQLAIARYELLGGVRGALTKQADAALLAATAATGRTGEQVLAGLLQLVSVDERGTPIRIRVPVGELPEFVPVELSAFTARRLLTTDTENGVPVIGVAHEAFLSAWPPLVEAIARHGTALRTRRTVEIGAAEWAAAGRRADRLWERGQLAGALNDLEDSTRVETQQQPRPKDPSRSASQRESHPWSRIFRRSLPRTTVDLSPRARDFLAASIRTDRRRRTRGTTVLTLLLVAALAAAAFAFVQQRSARDQQLFAEEQERVATARQLLAQAESVEASDPRTAEGLSLAANGLFPGRQTEAGMFNHLVGSQIVTSLEGHTEPVWPVAFGPDGHTLASGSDDDTVILWDVANPSRPTKIGQPLTGHTGTVRSVAFSADGHTLASGSADHTVILWDVANPGRPTRIGQPLTGHTGPVWPVAFSPNGHTLASGSGDHTVILWDITDPARPTRMGQPLTGHTGVVRSVAFTPDGRTLATGSDDHSVILWNVTTPGRATRIGQPLTGHTNEVKSVAFSPDGRTLASASADHTVILWGVADLGRPTKIGQPLTGHTDEVKSVAFSPDGRTLATGSYDHRVILWDVTDRGRPRSQTLVGHTGTVESVAFSPDGRTLASGGDDRTVILWDAIGPAGPTQIGTPLAGHTGTVESAALSPDGHTLASGGDDHTVILWDVTDPARPARIGEPLTGHTGPVETVAFSPDGSILASGADDQKVILWDVTDPSKSTPIGQPPVRHTHTVESVAFTPDGSTLATGSYDSTVILWDVTDPSRMHPIGQPFTGRTGPVWSVAFTPDGKTLATGIDNGTAALWNVADPERPDPIGLPLTGHTGPVRSVTFSPDGRTLTTGGTEGTLILWNITEIADLRDHLQQRACTLTAGGLRPEELTRYVPNLPFLDPCIG